MLCLHLCLCPHAHRAREGQKSVGSSETAVTDACELARGCWEPSQALCRSSTFSKTLSQLSNPLMAFGVPPCSSFNWYLVTCWGDPSNPLLSGHCLPPSLAAWREQHCFTFSSAAVWMLTLPCLHIVLSQQTHLGPEILTVCIVFTTGTQEELAEKE